MRRSPFDHVRRLGVSALLLLLGGCGGASDEGTGPSAALSVALVPASGTVVQGNSLQAAVGITRTGYAGDVVLGV